MSHFWPPPQSGIESSSATRSRSSLARTRRLLPYAPSNCTRGARDPAASVPRARLLSRAALDESVTGLARAASRRAARRSHLPGGLAAQRDHAGGGPVRHAPRGGELVRGRASLGSARLSQRRGRASLSRRARHARARSAGSTAGASGTARSHGKARFVNKHPRNSVRIDYLRRVFPDARFIHVIRDGRAVVSSIVAQIRGRARRAKQPMGGFCRPPGWRALLRDDLVEQTALQWQAIVRHVRGRRRSARPRLPRGPLRGALRAAARGLSRACSSSRGSRPSEAQLAGIPERPARARATAGASGSRAQEIASVEKTAGDLLAELGYTRVISRAPVA